MTTEADICNRMLQKIGTRTTVTVPELRTAATNEAIQFNLMYTEVRDTLLRKAPWNCAMKTANLRYITSQPGTPENQSPATQEWKRGLPSPPWLYEYQYPIDCLEARRVIPSTQLGFSGDASIASFGGVSSGWRGQPIRFQINTDEFSPATNVLTVTGGQGYEVDDLIWGAAGPKDQPPIGGPVELRVTSIMGNGSVVSVEIMSEVADDKPPFGGSYFKPQLETQSQGETSGNGTGYTFRLAFAETFGRTSQRVVLTNQASAALVYTKRITDPDVFDPSFREALYCVGAAQLALALQGSKELARMLIEQANAAIQAARQTDGNEGLTVNDLTPDWIRTRGFAYVDDIGWSGPYQGYDWGSDWPLV